ncbi:MAG: hypothetical protein LBT78_02765 [Tannerella sp.]|jgi:hypothetical protein|nr:hypothetical protein [Tannerella sp.]
MILTKYFLYKKIRALSKASLMREHCYRSLDDVRYILVMCEARDWRMVAPCIEALKAMKKTVHVCVYTQKQDDAPIWDYAYLLVEAGKDINLWSFPDKNIRSQLNSLSVDMLMDLTSGEYPVMRYLMLQQPSFFKVGAKHALEGDFYDLSIVMADGVHDIPFLFRQIISYLKIIRSNNH